MKVTAKALTLVGFLAAISLPASAGTIEEQAAAQFRSFGPISVKNSVSIPVSKPGYALTRDVFREVDACSVLNAQFIMQPLMKDALNMLKSCLAGVSDLTGKAPISASAVNSGKAIEIVVLGGKNKDVQELVSGALAKRNNRLFGYPASAVLHAAAPLKSGPSDVFSQVPACSVVDAQFFIQPLMKDALSMLKPCLDGVSKLSGGAPISAGAVNNGKALEIVVLGGKNKDVMELINISVVQRRDHLFGYPAAVVLHAAAPL